MDSRPAMAIFELLDYIVNEVWENKHIFFTTKHISIFVHTVFGCIIYSAFDLFILCLSSAAP